MRNSFELSRSQRAGWAASLGVLSLVVFSVPIYEDWASFRMQWHDQGHLFQILTNLFIRGEFYSAEMGVDHLGVHFTPIFFLFAPLVALCGDVLQYGILHAAFFAAAVVVMFFLAKEITESDWVASVMAGLLLVNPYVQAANLSIHFESMFYPLCLGYLLALRRGAVVWTLVLLFFCLTIKQDIWLYCIAATPLVVDKKNFKLAGWCYALIAAYFLLILETFYPFFYPERINRMTAVWSFATSKKELLLYFLEDPLRALEAFKNSQVAHWVFPLSAFACVWIPVRFLPSALLILLWVNSTDASRANMNFYYSYAIMPMVLASLPLGYAKARWIWNAVCSRWLNHLKPSVQKSIWVVLLIPVLYNIYERHHAAYKKDPLAIIPNIHLKSLYDWKADDWKHRRNVLKTFVSNQKDPILTQFGLIPYVLPRPVALVTFLDWRRVFDDPDSLRFVLLDTSAGDGPFSHSSLLLAKLHQDLRWKRSVLDGSLVLYENERYKPLKDFSE